MVVSAMQLYHIRRVDHQGIYHENVLRFIEGTDNTSNECLCEIHGLNGERKIRNRFREDSPVRTDDTHFAARFCVG